MSFASAAGGRGVAGRVFGPIITYPSTRHTATVIMLHGLGDTGNGWAPVAPQMELSHIKWVFPTAPTRPITVNMGMSMPGWFDLDHLEASAFETMMKGKSEGYDPPGVAESVEYVKALVQNEVDAGIPVDRIVVGGFSQGGHVALKTVLQHASKLAGCVAMSTWLEPAPMTIPDANLEVPFFYGHGTADPLIPPVVATMSSKILEDLGVKDLEFKMYPGMQHSTCSQEMQDLRRFLTKVLPEKEVSREDVLKMSAKELKQFLQLKGASSAGLFEKQELIDKALSLL